ncbi:HAD-IA family hydrolase [Sphingomonas sp. 2R-10]|uniref:HAD-IA family hydrolase n=1 Tax=Sphingomonas sp. 2R-10 TaxID=3045148 RepID=UPI000F792B19|nr:HAD-IA family hydrolase [Sphingomonas sp. 2R-10]MDJ0278368.1 HAD-IA family hydrolase [Sphingomonas sp. 2R-10]
MPLFCNTRYAAFLFDMDGTLLDSTAAVERVWRRWCARHGIDAEALIAVCHGVRGEDTVRRFATPGMDIATEAQWLIAAELEDVDGIVAIDGVHALIAGLAPTEWAIVTSAPRNLAEVRLRAIDLPIPQVFITAEDVTAGKPDPQGFRLAADRLGVSIADCLVFEDSPAGVAAGKAAGAAVAIVGPRVAPEEGTHAITDYR